jgi:hypothetical protein
LDASVAPANKETSVKLIAAAIVAILLSTATSPAAQKARKTGHQSVPHVL